ncbi:MAG TPA: putative lipid II flippase FtsW [Candidatus Limnocylindria bacterium]|nr:putative lipid II flippase FtsW [Candidatus Limnocylindria bacterium]
MNRGDRWLLVLPLALTALGVVMVYSSSAILGITRHQDPNHFLTKQMLRAGIGVVAMLMMAKLPLRRLERAAPFLLAAAAGLLGLVIVIGHAAGGSERWLHGGVLNVQFQPTDFARVAAIVCLAWWLKRRPPAEHGFVRGLLVPLGVLTVLCGLIAKQPNLSSAMMLGLIGLGMLFLAGAPLRHLAVPVGAGAAGVAVALATHPYQWDRVRSYLDFVLRGTLETRGSGWQLDQSLIALGSGGWLGRGLGGGLQKYLFLPEAHTDFIFSILGEELGFLGATILLGLIALYLWRGLRTAVRASDAFAFLVAGGLTLQIGFYALVNLAVATGLAPTTGLPLPFVSYGGSALLLNLAAAGLLYRVSVGNERDEALARQRWGAAA